MCNIVYSLYHRVKIARTLTLINYPRSQDLSNCFQEVLWGAGPASAASDGEAGLRLRRVTTTKFFRKLISNKL